MKLKDISFYYRKLLSAISSTGGALTIISAVFGTGYAVGSKYERNLANKEISKMENEYILNITERENAHLKEVVELKNSYSIEIIEYRKIKNSNEDEKRK